MQPGEQRGRCRASIISRLIPPIPSPVCWKRGDGKHRNHVGTRAEVLGWGAIAGSPAQTRVPVRLGGVSRSLAPVLGLDPAKTSRQPLWPASKVTHQSACGMPRLSRLGTYLALHAPRGQASVRSSTPAAAAGEAAGSLHGSHREVRPLSMAGGVYRAGS